MEAGYQQLQVSKPTLVVTPQLRPPDLPKGHAYTLKPGYPPPGLRNLLRLPIACQAGAGILTCFPSATTLVLTLGADSPCADERGAGNLGLSASGPFTRFIATHVSIRTSDTSSSPHGSAFTGLRNAPLPLTPCGVNPKLRHVTLAPIHCRRRNPYLDQ